MFNFKHDKAGQGTPLAHSSICMQTSGGLLCQKREKHLLTRLISLDLELDGHHASFAGELMKLLQQMHRECPKFHTSDHHRV